MKETVTVDLILSTLIDWVENRQPINPELWIESGLKMNLLKEPLNVKIIALESSLAQKRYDLLLSGKTAAYANIAVKADPDYAECEQLRAKIKMIEEQIRLAKVRGKMGLSDYQSQ